MSYDNTDKGALFKNEDKTPDKPNWSDYQGSINVGGVEYWIDAWIKESKQGKKFMSLAVRAKEEKKEAQEYHVERPSAQPFDDDIPF